MRAGDWPLTVGECDLTQPFFFLNFPLLRDTMRSVCINPNVPMCGTRVSAAVAFRLSYKHRHSTGQALELNVLFRPYYIGKPDQMNTRTVE